MMEDGARYNELEWTRTLMGMVNGLGIKMSRVSPEEENNIVEKKEFSWRYRQKQKRRKKGCASL